MISFGNLLDFLTLKYVIYQGGYSPLVLAAAIGLHDIAEVLLDAKADIDYVAEACGRRVLLYVHL